jgi:hypothetical protein
VPGAAIVKDMPKWERLSGAVDRIVNSADISREQVTTDLCRALSDGDIEVRAKLAKHAFRLQTSSDVVSGSDLQIPTQLKPSDFDWQRSRPIKPWSIFKRSPRHGGPWHLENIEICAEHVTERVLPTRSYRPVDDLGPATRLKRKKRTRSSRIRAEEAIKACYRDDVPGQDVIPNGKLCDKILQYLKKHEQLAVSADTILRAAGRRK